MSTTLVATIAGLFTAFCWGTSDFLAAKSTKKISTLEINFATQVTSLALVGILFFVSGVHIGNEGQLLRIALGSILITTAYLVFVKALSLGLVSIVVPLSNIYPLFTILLSAVFLSTTFKSVQLGAMVGIVVGAALLTYEKNINKVPIQELYREAGLAFTAALIWGVAFFIINPVVREVTWQTINIVGEVFSFLFATLLILVVRKRQAISAVRQSLRFKTPLMVGIVGTTGFFSLYLGSGRAGSLVIPTVLSACGPLVASLWGAIIDKERIGFLKRVGAVIIVAGVIIINTV